MPRAVRCAVYAVCRVLCGVRFSRVVLAHLCPRANGLDCAGLVRCRVEQLAARKGSCSHATCTHPNKHAPMHPCKQNSTQHAAVLTPARPDLKVDELAAPVRLILQDSFDSLKPAHRHCNLLWPTARARCATAAGFVAATLRGSPAVAPRAMVACSRSPSCSRAGRRRAGCVHLCVCVCARARAYACESVCVCLRACACIRMRVWRAWMRTVRLELHQVVQLLRDLRSGSTPAPKSAGAVRSARTRSVRAPVRATHVGSRQSGLCSGQGRS
jgi:hypothetical protein